MDWHSRSRRVERLLKRACWAGVIFCAALLVFDGQPSPPSPSAAVGVLVDGYGVVERRAASDVAWRSVSVGAQVFGSDTLYVSRGGFAEVRLGNEGTLRSSGRSLLVLPSERDLRDATVLRYGTVALSASKKAAARVTAGPWEVVASPGSELVVVGKVNDELDVFVATGTAHLASERGAATKLKRGHAAHTRDGEVRATVACATLSWPPLGYVHRVAADRPEPLELRWSGPGAEGLLLRVVHTANGAMYERAASSAGAHTFQPPTQGTYAWQLYAHDQPCSQPGSFVSDVARPPMPVWPRGRIQRAAPEPLALSWDANGCTRVAITMSRDGQLVLEREVHHANVTTLAPPPAPGRYAWTVACAEESWPEVAPAAAVDFELLAEGSLLPPTLVGSEIHDAPSP